jgi:hypothetical protein
MNIQNLILAICACIAVGFAANAWADPGNGHGRGHGRDDDGVRVIRSSNHDVVVIDDTDRGRIHDFLAEHFRSDCPPGLAKKHNGCLPPGQAKKHYVGEVLTVERPRTIWQALADLISPPPAGYRYVREDRSVLLVNDRNRVVDIVDVD